METEEGYVYECIHCGFISKGEFEFCANCHKNDEGQLKKDWLESINKLFDGRVSRTMFLFLVSLLTLIYFSIVLLFTMFPDSMIKQFLFLVLSVGILFFELIIGIRRMHDLNLSGWFSMIPIFNLIIFFKKGSIAPNKYGDAPVEIIKNNFVTNMLMLVWSALMLFSYFLLAAKFFELNVFSNEVGIWFFIIFVFMQIFIWQDEKSIKKETEN